ncbi:MAG: putative membrane protein [Cellvibrionaceae bacterium]|jgi:putative membrane protein
MNEITRRLLLSYEWRPVFIFVLVALAVLYSIGWMRLRKRSKNQNLVPIWKLVAYLVAIVTLLLALLSFIDILGASLFYFHMIQHLMLTAIAGPLIMLADPMPITLWGLPRGVRKAVGRGLSKILHKDSRWREPLKNATSPGVSFVVMVVLLWGWHDPYLYNLALTNPLIHDLEHIAFFYSSVIYWWHVTGAGPRIRPIMSRPKRIVYLFGGVPSTFVPGVSIAFAGNILYTYYLTAPPAPAPFFLPVLDDQIIGGIIMWVPGSMMFFIGALVLIGRWLQDQEKQSKREKEKWMRENNTK